jgi:hypothetical protein
VLLAHPAVDPTACDNDAIRLASANGHVRVVEVLLAHTAVDPSAYRYAAFHSAASKGHVEVFGQLLRDLRCNLDEVANVLRYLRNPKMDTLLAEERTRRRRWTPLRAAWLFVAGHVR